MTTSPAANHVQSQPSMSGPMIYRREDYIGALRHLVIFGVDSFVILFIFVPLGVVFAVFSAILGASPSDDSMRLFLLGPWLILSWVYLAVLKPSRFRSIGYWIADAKIVTIYGLPPSPGLMTLRLLWTTASWTLGFPVGIFTDLVWTTMEDERQMLRDLFAQTRLIRNHARPIGVGKVSHCLFTGLGITLYYARVRAKVFTSVNPLIEVSSFASTNKSSTRDEGTIPLSESNSIVLRTFESRAKQTASCGSSNLWAFLVHPSSFRLHP